MLAGTAIDVAQTAGIFVVAKHFPGHGWVDADSHTDLPYDTRDFKDICAADLVPFMAHRSKYDCIMPAHIIFSQIDSLPVTFSKIWLQQYLRQEWSYLGVVVSDDLSMAGSRSMGSLAECGEAALEAGCDIVLMCNDRIGVCEALSYLERKERRQSSVYLLNFMERLKKQLYRNGVCLT